MSTIIPIRPGVRIMAEDNRGEFFAVGRDSFIKACDLGMNTAVAFLIMASGTGRANKLTWWSAESVGKYAGTRWSTADKAIKKLKARKQIKRVDNGEHGTRRCYELQVKGDLIWLPRSIIEGVGDESAPIRKLRQTQDVMALRLFIELYHAQNLRDDGGISMEVVKRKYDRKKYGERGQWDVWGFNGEMEYVYPGHEVAKPHQENKSKPFFDRLHTLHSLGLIQCVPTLYEGKDGEPMHAIDNFDMAEAICDASCSLLSEGHVDSDRYDFLIPVERHMQAVQLYGVYRLRYRPWTAATRDWMAANADTQRHYIRQYKAIAGQHFMAEVG